MNDLEIEKRLTTVEERSKSNTHRIDRLEPIVEEIHRMSETLVEITNEMKHTNDSIKQIGYKVDSLEKEPGQKWKDSTKMLFNAILGSIGAAVAAGIIYILTMIN